MSAITLFPTPTLTSTSEMFTIDKQVTITAVGLAEGDTITFERIEFNSGRPPAICGCAIVPFTGLSILSTQPLMCPTCPTEGVDEFYPVRLTARNPVVILDYPQNSVIRAVYNGVALDMGEVRVTARETSTTSLTEAMRGCPTPCCGIDYPETWDDTGVQRCDDNAQLVELQQVSNCGNTQWVTSPDQPQQYWSPTGAKRCDAGAVYEEKANPCGDRRWDFYAPEAWVRTGMSQCSPTNVQYQEQNQCGDLRWVDGPAIAWTPTGTMRCTDVNIQQLEQNQCGDIRWVPAGPVVWTPTGVYDCTNYTKKRQEQNQCGDVRWVDTGEACGESEHDIVSVTPTATTQPNGGIMEGEDACWTVTLDQAVQGTPLVIYGNISGSELPVGQVRVTFPVGASTAVVCVPTIDDSVVEGPKDICLTFDSYDGRVNATPDPSCIPVGDNDVAPEQPYTLTLTVDPAVINTAGNYTVTYTLTASRPIEGTPLTVTLTDTVCGNAAVVIPVGQTSVQHVCSNYVANAGDDKVNNATANAGPRGQNQPTATVVTDVPTAPVDSVHTVTSITPANNPIIEGQQACYTIQLNGPVANSALQVNFTLSGSDQARHNYPAPVLTIPVGQSQGQVCVTTIDDGAVDGTEQLTITSVTSPRLTNSASATIDVQDNDSVQPTPQIVNITSDATGPVAEGQDICYTVYSDLPAPAGGLPFTVTVSGSDTPEGSVCGSYDGSTNGPVITTLSGSIPQGQTQATVCYVRDVAEPADSSHEVTVNVATNTVEEGQQICWNFVTTGVVAGSPLTIPFTFSGTEQSVHNYPAASVVVPVGQTQAQYCLTITDDAIVEGPLELCLDVTVGGRVTSTQSADNCVTVNDNDSSAPSIAFSGMGYNWGDCIGGATVTQARLRIEVHNDGTYEVRTITSASPSGQNIVQDSGTWATGAFNAADYNVIFAGSEAPNSEGTPNPNGGNLASLQVLEWMDGMDPTAQIVNGDVQIRDASNNVLASLPIYVTLSSNVECP